MKCNLEEIALLLKMMAKGYKVPQDVHDIVMDVAKREIEDKERVVIYKRDPNVHNRRIQGSYVKVTDGSTIEIHPCATGGFGADFDGDSVWGRIRCDVVIGSTISENHNKLEKELDLCDFLNLMSDYLVFKEKKNNITKYNIKEDVKIFIKSINIETGIISDKEIIEFSIHDNLNMYKLKDKNERFESFWVSTDHSLIIYDEKENCIKKISPIELLENPDGKFLIKEKLNM